MFNEKEMKDALLSLEKSALGLTVAHRFKELLIQSHQNGEEIDPSVFQHAQEFLEEINKEQQIAKQYMNKIFGNEE